MLPLQCSLKQNFFPGWLKLINHSVSAVNVELSKTVELYLYQKLRYLFLLSTCTDELTWATNIITFSLNSPLGIDNVPRISNTIYIIRTLIKISSFSQPNRNPCMGLFFRSEEKLSLHCLKLDSNMLETQNLVRK